MIVSPNGNASLAVSMLVAVLLPQAACGGSGVWNIPAGGSWIVSANWGGNLVAGGAGANAGFITNNLTNDAVVTLDGFQTVGSLGFRDTTPSHNWFLNAGSGGLLTLDSSSNVPAINVFNQTATIGVVIAGNKGFAKTGSGTLILTAANTYSGGTQVTEGLLQINHVNGLQGAVTTATGTILWLNAPGASHASSISGSGLVQVSPGSTTTQLGGSLGGFTGTLDIISATNAGKVIFSNTGPSAAPAAGATVRVRSGSTFCLGPADTTVNFPAALELNGAGNSENLGALRIERGAVWSGPVTLKADSFIGVNNGIGTIMGSIGESGGSFGLAKQGAQALVLGGENTYSGNTILNGSGGIYLKNELALKNSTLLHTSGDLYFSQSVGSHAFVFGGLAGSGNVALQDDSAARAPVKLSVGGNHAGTSHSGCISGPGSLEKIGSGIWTISGRNTYAGSTTVSGGTLRLAVPSGFPVDLRIMPLGDSITYGYNGNNAGYRGPLYNLLFSVALNFRFIGTSIERPGSLPVSPVDQRHNEGHSSYTLNDVNHNLDGFDNTRFLLHGGADRNPNGGHWFDGIPNVRDPAYPDVILMMLGTNEMTNLADVRARLHDLIVKITTLRPSARLLVAKVTPLTASAAGVAEYNSIVVDEVAGFASAGKSVRLVDLNTGFPANGLDPDGIHPNDTGFNFMAGKWFEAITAAISDGGAAFPENSPTAVAQGAVLDMNGLSVTAGDLTGEGEINLGAGGILTVNSTAGSVYAGSVTGTGEFVKTGDGVLTVAGNIHPERAVRVNSGVLRVSGAISGTGLIEVASGAVLELVGGTLTARTVRVLAGGLLKGSGTIVNELVNDGGVGTADGGTLFIGSRLTNNGWIRMTGGSSLTTADSLFNHGSLDIITGVLGAPEKLVNDGIVVDSEAMAVNSISKCGCTVTATICSHTGHTYQFQYSATLQSASWENTAPPQEGVTGNVLEFSTDAGASGERGFYRIRVSP